MFRRTALVTFCCAVILVAACGRQITPDPILSSTNLAGRMQIRFRTSGALDFSKYTYAIVVDTCGGGAPLPNVFGTTFNNYSFAFLVGGTAGTAIPTLLQYVLTPSATNPLNPQQVPLGASTTQLVLNSDQQNDEFQLTFVRQQLDNPLGVRQPCATIPVPSPGPTAAASPQPTTAAQATWVFNFFTIDSTTNRVVDSLGVGGAQDNTFGGVSVAVDATDQIPIFRQPGSTPASDQAAAISGGEIDNFL